MKCVVQRVQRASVQVDEQVVGSIEHGLLVLAGIAHDDTDADLRWTADKLATLRIFPFEEKHFELNVREVGGAVLLVSNFTVCAQARKGRRPSLDGAAPPEQARALFDRFVAAMIQTGIPIQTGQFAAPMQVALVNDGPATFLLDSAEARAMGNTPR